MKKIELQEIKKIELDMIRYLDDICKKNDIHYYMVGGTLLGAVRHKGFIPWDDDIDIAMPRQDFKKLKEVFNNNQSYYKLQFYDNTEEYGYPSPKLVDTRTTLIDYKLGNGKEESSIFIDIFLYDGMGRTFLDAKMRYYFLKIFKRAVFLSRRNFKMETFFKTIIFALPWLICNIVGVDKLNQIYNFLAARKDFYTEQIVACAAGRYGKSELFYRDVFEKTIDLQFEDIYLPAPIKYREYLTNLYGDYMKLPPEDKRISNHTSEAWWKE